MTFLTPWGLLALLAVPAVVVLHLFRNRLRERRIAGAFLFPAQVLQAGAGRTRTRLLRTPSFWCELLAATLLGLWLGGLSFGGRAVQPLVVVLDDSASMAATGARERALAAVRERLRGRPAGSFLVLLRSGARPETLLDARERGADVEAALQRWQPAQPRHDVRLSLELARELAGPAGEVLFVTDERPPAGHDDVHVRAVGVPAANLAVQTVERRAGAAGQGDELRVRVVAHGAAARAVLAVQVDARPATERAAELREGAAEFVIALAPGDDLVRLQLAPDALAIDDVAWSLPTPPRVVAVADSLAPELRQQLALDRVFAAVSDWRPPAAGEAAQLLLRSAPGEVAAGQLEIVFTAGQGDARAWQGPFLVDRSEPWLQGVFLHGVTWVAGDQDLPGRVLIAAGAKVLASEEPLAAGRRWWLGVHGAAGNLVRAPDWPVLFANLLDGCRAEVPGLEQVHVRVGEEVRCRRARAEADDGLTLVAPDGRRHPGRGGTTVGWRVVAPGLHRVLGPGDVDRGRCVARFHDPSESDLGALVALDRPAAPSAAAARAAPVRDTGLEGRLLALLAVVVLVLDWWLLARRDA